MLKRLFFVAATTSLVMMVAKAALIIIILVCGCRADIGYIDDENMIWLANELNKELSLVSP